MANPKSDPKQILSSDHCKERSFSIEESVVTLPTRLISVLPNYFRGFRKIEYPVDLSSNLVVIDGRNSSGKTSLSEALEWLFSGELIRRKMQGQGDPKELENCITNQLKPEDEECWVQADLQTNDDSRMVLKRVLVSDYGSTSTSVPESQLYLDDRLLSEEEASSLMEELFAGIPPLLMQHSLRSFVLSSPTDRRKYFENLLSLDELTFLIEKAVIGDTQAAGYISPTGSKALIKWHELSFSVSGKESEKALTKSLKKPNKDLANQLTKTLIQVAVLEFSKLASEGDDLNAIQTALGVKQQEKRQEALPILSSLKPSRVIDESLKKTLSGTSVKDDFEKVITTFGKLETARTAAKGITQAKLTVAKTFDILSKAGLIVEADVGQDCPLCDFKDAKTLLPSRTQEIAAWVPLQEATSTAKSDLSSSIKNLKESLEALQVIRKKIIPNLLPDKEWSEKTSQAEGDVLKASKAFRKDHKKAIDATKQMDKLIQEVLDAVSKPTITLKEIQLQKKSLEDVEGELKSLLKIAPEYANAFEMLDKAVGSSTGEDPQYSLREQWIDLSNSIGEVSAEIKFEKAKSDARKELKYIRDFLIEARQSYLDLRRTDFSNSINDIWEQLRDDRYSSFSKLHIPKPSGKGFPVKIEVKATLDDSANTIEVDALKVFSESQVNVLGIAAFITRAKLLGHQTIIFDDPVQSMDEEHFKTFASRLIPFLLDDGFHVVILTHNDQFARDLSHSCIDIDGYVTMKIRHSRREGCLVDVGNRRVGERINKAEKKVDDGELEEAWRYVRLAIERFYLITRIKYGAAGFKPSSWADQSAEYMWNDSVGSILTDKLPEAPLRLKEILDMTAPGAHDKSATGETDIRRAIDDIRKYLNDLGLRG